MWCFFNVSSATHAAATSLRNRLGLARHLKPARIASVSRKLARSHCRVGGALTQKLTAYGQAPYIRISVQGSVLKAASERFGTADTTGAKIALSGLYMEVDGTRSTQDARRRCTNRGGGSQNRLTVPCAQYNASCAAASRRRRVAVECPVRIVICTNLRVNQ